MYKPRVLVVSNNCFSKGGSNGRTLANFFKGWPKKNLAQFYISNEIPDSEVCDKYFRVTDKEVLKSFFYGGEKGTVVELKVNGNFSNKFNKNIKVKKTPLKCLLREFVWRTERWRGRKFDEWVYNFNPELILIQSGDSAFMINIATKLSKKFQVPLIIYNSEGYYFKEKNYFRDSSWQGVFYPIFIRQYKKSFEKMIEKSSYSIYSCDMLKDSYDRKFNNKSETIMTATDFNKSINDNKCVNNEFTVSYLGNLNVGRHESLIEIAECLQEIDEKIYLDIYGKVDDKKIISDLVKCKGIRYKGMISYDEVISTMKKSNLLIHAENFGEFYKWDLKYAFSTKIADSLASGTCFFVYSPIEMASTEYLWRNKYECLAIEKNELKSKLNKVINDKNFREKCIKQASKLASLNHNNKLNREKFQDILIKTFEGEK